MMISFNYLFQKYRIRPTGILHLGSSTGQEMATYRQLGMSPVIFVEAIPDVFEQLKRNMLSYPEAICINECVGEVDGKEVVFNVSNNEAQSSSYLELSHHKVIHPEVHYIDKIPMKTKTVQTIVKEHSIDLDRIKFFSADLQGTELLALKGAGGLLGGFDYLYLEVNKRPVYQDCAHVDEIDQYVDQFGFKRVETGNWVADSWTDALFAKTA